MLIELVLGEVTINIISAYAPQIGFEESIKQKERKKEKSENMLV
jgi:purine-cytosine permease-like protein